MNIMILVNKDFEYAGYKAGVDSRIRTNKVTNLHEIAYDAGIGPDKSHISRMYKVGDNTIREYCISYLFPAETNTSNSEMKYALVRNLIKQENKTNNIDLIISVSTSETTDFETASMNGCVLIGSSFYAKDCSRYDPSTESYLEVKDHWFATDRTKLSGKVCNRIGDMSKIIADGIVDPPKEAATQLKVIANNQYVSLGVVNVMDYSRYEVADEETYEAYKSWSEKGENDTPVCLETTHSVVKMASKKAVFDEKEQNYKNIPVLFVSPIVDRYKMFSKDVDGKWGGQNLTSSYNAGVVVANMMEHIISQFK